MHLGHELHTLRFFCHSWGHKSQIQASIGPLASTRRYAFRHAELYSKLTQHSQASKGQKLRLVLFRTYSWSHNHIISLGEYYRYIQIPCWSLLWLFCRYLRCTADRGQTLQCTELDVSRSFKLDCPWHLMANNMRIRIHVKVVKVQILSIILSLLNLWKHGMINMVLPRKGCAACLLTLRLIWFHT